jgi:hypothetical protein
MGLKDLRSRIPDTQPRSVVKAAKPHANRFRYPDRFQGLVAEVIGGDPTRKRKRKRKRSAFTNERPLSRIEEIFIADPSIFSANHPDVKENQTCKNQARSLLHILSTSPTFKAFSKILSSQSTTHCHSTCPNQNLYTLQGKYSTMTILRDGIKIGGAYAIAKMVMKEMNKKEEHNNSAQYNQPASHHPPPAYVDVQQQQQHRSGQYISNDNYIHADYCNGTCGSRCNKEQNMRLNDRPFVESRSNTTSQNFDHVYKA